MLTDHGLSVETVQHRQRVDQLYEIMLDMLYESSDSLGDAENCVFLALYFDSLRRHSRA